MSTSLSVFFFCALFAGLIVLAVSYKTGHFIRSVLLSAVSGIGALFAVNLLAYLTSVSIAVNYITLAVSGIFGIPGVIALLFMN